MANWQRQLDVSDVWEQAKAGEVTPQELAGIVAARLATLEPFNIDEIDEQRDELAADFRALAKDNKATANDFNSLWDALYDWADTRLDHQILAGRKVCWINRWKSMSV